MTRKKAYSGTLVSPLPPPPVLVGSEDFPAEMAAYDGEIRERFTLLMRHYQIDATLPSSWQSLAMRLAEDHVPGLRPWKPTIDSDRYVRILLRMSYMIRVRGFSEIGAANAVSRICPDLGDAKSVRSLYREAKIRPTTKSWFDMCQKIEDAIGRQGLEECLFVASDPDFVQLRAIEKSKLGRPRKK